MSKSFRARLLAAACGLGITAGLATAVHAESLADAIALAYQTNPTLQAQRATQRALDENVVQAKAGFRPTINLTASRQDVDIRGGAEDVVKELERASKLSFHIKRVTPDSVDLQIIK